MVRWIRLLARLVVGGVWIWAGALKLPNLESSVTAVRAYQLLPLGSTDTVGRLLPLVEVAVGVLLVVGLLTRASGVVSALLLIAFIVGISSVWARGISINCGCFGDGGYDPNAASRYPWEIARDVALTLGSLLLVWRPRTPLSVDGWLFPERSSVDDTAPHTEVLEGTTLMATKNREQNRSERAAAIQRDQQRKERTKRAGITVAVVVVVAALIGAAFWATRGSGDSAAASGTSNLKVVRDGTAMVVGNNPDAKVKVTVYEDFLCPYCRQFETSSRDFLHADAAKGKVLITYQPFHLLPEAYSKQSLEAWGQVLAGSSGKQALRFHDLLYDNQPYENASSFPSASDLRALAGKAGVSGSVQKQIGSADDSYYQGAQKAASGIDSTPTVMVNGQRFGENGSVDQLVSGLEKKIADE